jgi:hypothetical protein
MTDQEMKQEVKEEEFMVKTEFGDQFSALLFACYFE